MVKCFVEQDRSRAVKGGIVFKVCLKQNATLAQVCAGASG